MLTLEFVEKIQTDLLKMLFQIHQILRITIESRWKDSQYSKLGKLSEGLENYSNCHCKILRKPQTIFLKEELVKLIDLGYGSKHCFNLVLVQLKM